MLYIHDTFYILYAIWKKRSSFAKVKMCAQNIVCSYNFSVFEKVLGELEKQRCVKVWSKAWKTFQKKIK